MQVRRCRLGLLDMPIIPLKDVGKGVNKDLLPSELGAGFWSDCSNVRFRNGFAESFEGATSRVTLTITPYWITPYTGGTVTYGVYAGSARVQVTSTSSSATNITRYTEGAVISSITRVGTTATLTTATNHGRTTGDTVSIWGASPSQYNGTYTITVTGATTFTYTMASDPGASASPVGLYSYDVISDFTGAQDDRWSGGSLNGVLLMNNPVNGLYYWNGDTSIRLRKVPLSYVADVTRPFKTYAVQLAPTIGGVKFPQTVLWSATASPGALPSTFVPSSTNDARSVPLAETPGNVIDCLPLGDVNIVYKNDSIYSMQYVGGEFVFRFTRLPGNDGLMFRGCVANTPVGHVFLTQDYDIKLHNGDQPRSIIDGRLKNWLSNVIQEDYVNRSFFCVNKRKDEVWFVFSGPNGVGQCNMAIAWNWKSDTWGIFDFPTKKVTYGDSGLWPTFISTPSTSDPPADLVLSTTDGIVGGVGDLFLKFFGANVECRLQRDGLHFDDRSTFKTLHRSRWNFDVNSTKTATVYHGSYSTADGTPTFATGVGFTTGTTDFADARSTAGRYLSIKMEFQANSYFALRSVDLDVTSGGTR